ncbi:putative solute carrier family 22 member 31, partial [Scleropages formosus]
WNLVCENYWKVPLQHICFMMGCMLGYIFMGTLCDRLGRRRAFLVSVALSGLLGMAVCLSNGPLVFLLLRLCQGAMLSGIFLSSYIARLAAMCRDWPVLQAVATVPLLLLLSYWCSASIFPESPRWLLATHQILQARKCLENISTRNGVCVGEELYPAESLLAEMDVAYPDDSEPRFHHVLELRHSRVIWRNGLILGFTLFISTGIQYCFTRNLHGFSHHFYLTYFVRVATGAVACALLCVTVERCGRRGVLLLSAITTGLSSLLLLALTQYLRSGLVLVLSVVGLLSSQALAMLSVFFASEVLPTVNNSGYFLHNVVFASFAVLSVLCVMLLPETKSKPLPDSLKDGENQRRPAFFASRPGRDSLPLLRTLPHDSHYDPDSYSRLVSATKKMLAKDRSYGLPPPQQRPLLAVDNGLLDCQENKLLHEDNS